MIINELASNKFTINSTKMFSICIFWGGLCSLCIRMTIIQ